MARPVLARASSSIASFAIAFALIRSVAAVWFSSEIVATPRNDEVAAPPLTDRVVVVVIDGLRIDTALEGDLMPRLQAIARAGSAGLSMASQVTMTGLGVRTLGTGTSPGLADILLEARLPPVTFDNVFASLRRRGDHIARFGNPSWKELFGDYIDLDPKIDRSLEMLARADNVWAADTVIVRRAVQLMGRGGWQLCIVHLGGLDNAAHRFTPFGSAFRAKARGVDSDIARIVEAAGDRTTVIITSDHGTSDRGHHGSGEPITRRTPLVLTGAAVARGHTLDARQTDVAPTIAALLGVPIPAPSEGRILLDALELSPETATALHAANLRQLQRYANAYGAARDLVPPAIDATTPGMRRLGDWIEATRASSGLIPLLWAASLVLAVLARFGAPTPLDIASSVIAVGLATWSFATGGIGVPAALLAVLASSAFAAVALHRLPRRWATLCAGTAAVASIELAIVAWKLHHRFVEMKLHDVHGFLHASDHTFQLAMTIVAGFGATVVVRRWWPTSRWATIGLVVGASALADSIAMPAAIACGVAAAAALARPSELVPLAASAVAGIAAIAMADSDVGARLPVELAAPLVLAVLGMRLGPTTRRGRLALLGFGAAAALVRIADNSPPAYRTTLVAIAVISVVLARVDRDDRPLALLGWAGAIALAMLSRPAQLPGLVAWSGFAALVGRSTGVAASTERSIRAALLAVIGFRFACFALFEGAFEFSHLEVWLAYEGNPGTDVAFGAAIIAIKFALPLAIGVALITSRMAAGARRTAIAWTIGFLCLRIAHIVAGMTVARGTFYSPYLDSGQLVFTYLMLASVPIVIALFAAIGAWRDPPADQLEYGERLP
jgi:hypothetical protein